MLANEGHDMMVGEGEVDVPPHVRKARTPAGARLRIGPGEPEHLLPHPVPDGDARRSQVGVALLTGPGRL